MLAGHSLLQSSSEWNKIQDPEKKDASTQAKGKDMDEIFANDQPESNANCLALPLHHALKRRSSDKAIQPLMQVNATVWTGRKYSAADG